MVVVGVLAAVVALYFVRGLTIGDPTSASPLLWRRTRRTTSRTRTSRTSSAASSRSSWSPRATTEDAMKDPDVLRTMEKFQRYLERDRDVGYSFSLADIIRAVNMVFHELEPKWGVIPNNWVRRRRRLFFIFFSGSPPTETAKYVDSELHHRARDLLLQGPQGREHRAHHRALPRSSSPRTRWRRPTFKLAGGLIGVLAAANEELVRNDLLMNFLGFGTIYVIVLFTYRSCDGGHLPARCRSSSRTS